MIITITGFPGSGKSTLGKGIAKELGLRHYSAGDFLREIARERGLGLMQIQERMEKERAIDDELDRRTKELAEKEDDFVIDGRVAWFFVPKSIKIFVKVDLEKAAERIYNDTCKGHADRRGEEHKSKEHAVKNMRQRMEMNKGRYKKLYNVDYLDEKNYDIVVDTSDSGVGETRERVLNLIKEFVEKKGIE